MIIRNLKLINFRNYKNISIDFSDGINVFIGDNGTGKTNILEAIYTTGLLKSFRTSDDDNLVNNESDKMIIELEIDVDNLSKTIIYEFSKKERKKIIKINNSKLPKLSQIIGQIPIILFSPETIQIIKGEPSLRRQFLDDFILLIDNNYYNLLLKYQKIISHRNFILKKIKDGEQKLDALSIWDNQMIEIGCEIMLKRIEIINELNKILEKEFNFVKHHIKLSYFSKFFTDFISKENIINTYKETLPKIINEEIARTITLIGPHRDDILILFDDKLVKSFGSEGEQRIASIILKFSQAFIIKDKKSTTPVILLDDFSSELDEKNKNLIGNFFDFFKQIIITTTSFDNVKNLKINKKFTLSNENNIIIEETLS